MCVEPTEVSPTFSALVVDDDPGVRQSLRLCLEGIGGTRAGASSGARPRELIDTAIGGVDELGETVDEKFFQVEHHHFAHEERQRGTGTRVAPWLPPATEEV